MITLFLSTIVSATITNIYGPSVRDFGPVVYTLFLSVKRFRENKRENSKHNITIGHITDFENIFPDNELFNDEESESNQQLFVLVVLFRYVCP